MFINTKKPQNEKRLKNCYKLKIEIQPNALNDYKLFAVFLHIIIY